MKNASTLLLLILGALLQVACSSQAVYTGESFASDSPFRMRAEGEVAMACESARRALLGQGYLIDSASSESIKARKAYRTEDAQNTFIEMNIVCLGEFSGSELYATGVLTTYALKKSTSSASVGLSALGSISLPIGQSADSLVKVSEETIDDKDFYKRFFTAVDIILVEMRASRESAAPAPVEATPAVVREPAAVVAVPAAPVPVPSTAPALTPAIPSVNHPIAAAAETPPPSTPVQIAPDPAPAPANMIAPPTAEIPTPTELPKADLPAPAPEMLVPVGETQTVHESPAVSMEPDASATPGRVLEDFAAPLSEPFR